MMTKDNWRTQNGKKETDVEEFWLYTWNKMEKLMEKEKEAQ